MAARPKSGISIDTDVNLDFLTKEEKEALLSKKMDMIRQRNKALTERHQLIEADKKKAEEAGQAVKPTVDSQMLPAEGAPKPRGRGRGQTHNKDSIRPMKERPKSSGDLRDSSNYEPIVDTTDLANYRSKGHGGLHEREAPNNVQKNKKKSKEEATVYSSSFEYEPIIEMKDLDKRFGPLLNIAESRIWPRIDHGPPPDPSFNPLADRRRSEKKEDVVDHRRHPRNYGGTSDLSRVKQNMKNMREKEKERPQGTRPLEMVMTGKERKTHEDWKAERERYDKERIQRQMSDGGNWKRAWDADKISLENEEQSSYSLKMEPAKRPAGRIGSGRFDRGERDDHPRSAVVVKGTVQHTDHLQQQQQQQQQWQHHDQQQLPAQLHQHHSLAGENKPSRGRGRGRGRGRSRGGSGEKFPRPRTWSGGDDRFVECQKELLLVKFDNTAGDNSVEVEYDDDEFIPSPVNTSKTAQSATTQGRGPTGRTPNQTSKQQAREGKPQPQKSKTSHHKDTPQINAQSPTESKWNNSTSPQTSMDKEVVAAYGTDEIHVHTSSHSQGFGEGEEWEDDTESSAVQEENDSGISSMVLSSTTTSSSIHDLHLECRLNPEAPEFLPSSTDVIKTPTGPANTSPWNSGSRSSSPLSQDSAFSPQLTPGLSASPHTHSATQFHESSTQLPPLKNEENTVLKNDQSPPVPFEKSPPVPCEKSPPVLCEKSPPVLCEKSPPVLCEKSPPVPCKKSSLVLCEKSPPVLCEKSSPVLCEKSPPVSCEKSPPVPCEKSTPEPCEKSPPVPCKKSSPGLCEKSPPVLCEKSPPVLCEKSPPVLCEKSPPVSCEKSPPVSCEKSSPVPCKKSPPMLREKSPPVLCEKSHLLERKQADVDDHCGSEVAKPKEKCSEITDVTLCCLTSNDSGTKDTTLASNDMDRANVLSDASSNVGKEVLESNKVALNQEKTPTGHISASHAKRMTHNSLSDDSKNISRESATSLAAENTQDNIVAKDLMWDVSKMYDSSEGASESVTNGDGSDKLKLNGVSAVSEDHMFVAHEHGVAAGSLKEDSNRQEALNKPATTNTANISGPSESSQATVLHGSLNTPTADESTLPTADISAFS